MSYIDAYNDPRRPHRLLISYHYAKGKNLGEIGRRWWPHHPVRIFGDSGAFSALTQGASIDIGEYAEWLIENRQHLTVYANLDVIGDHLGSRRNLDELRRRGLSPLPVFHMGSPFSELERMIDAGEPYIALGGLVGGSADLLMRFAIKAFKLARAKERGTVFHGFGLTNIPAIMNLPWYSVDSSSWGSGFRYARALTFDPAAGKFISISLFTDAVDKHARLLTAYGADLSRLRDRKKYHHSVVAKLSALSWRALEAYCRRRHGAIYLPGTAADRDPGPHHYLVTQPKKAQRARDVNLALSDHAAGMHLYLATTTGIVHGLANQAMANAPGLHLYLADSNIGNHGLANEAVHQSAASNLGRAAK